MEIEVHGGLRLKKGRVVLSVYSSPFARYLMLNKINKAKVVFLKDLVEISKGGVNTLSIERKKEGHPLITISVSKIIPKILKKEIEKFKTQKQIRIKLKDFISHEELKKYNERTTAITPKEINLDKENDELLKVGCFVSCYRQNDKIWYRFNIRNKILEEVYKRKERVMICRKGDCFFIAKDKEGKEFRFYKGKQGCLAYMQMSQEFLNNDERKLFKDGRRAISFKAYLSAEEFNLDISQFFINKEERELAKELLNHKILIRIPEMRKREADIVFPETKSQIEVTRVRPRVTEKTKNTPHTEGVHIIARLCEGFLRVKKAEVNKFYVVFHEEWIKYEWVRKLCEDVKPGVITIPTSFEGGWAREVANKIEKNLT